VTELRAARLGFECRQGDECLFSFVTASRPVLWPTEPSHQWLPGESFLHSPIPLHNVVLN